MKFKAVVTGCREYGNKKSVFTKGGKVFEKLSDYQHLKKDCVP
jgi:hypothetical protein